MTRRNYDAFAAQIKASIAAGISEAEARFAAHIVVRVASEDNPRFDRDRFIAACGLTDRPRPTCPVCLQ